MKRTYTISHKIPKGINNFTPQGLRDIYDRSNASKRSREYHVEIECSTTNESNHIDTQLQDNILKAVESFFHTSDIEWATQNHLSVTRLRTLFLYQRDNTELWNKIESIILKWIRGLATETEKAELSDVLPTVKCVHQNLRFKIKRFYDQFYWFNPLVNKLYGSKNVLERLNNIYTQEFTQHPVIERHVELALLSLHHQCHQGVNPQLIGECLKFMVGVFGSDQFLPKLLDKLAARSITLLAQGNLDEFMQRYEPWKQQETNLWLQVKSNSDFQEDVEAILKQLEADVLMKALETYKEVLIPFLLEKPDAFEQFIELMRTENRVAVKLQQICKTMVYQYYQCVMDMKVTPIVAATLLCDFALTTLRGPVGNTGYFKSCWSDFSYDNAEFGRALAQLAAHTMQKQKYQYVIIISDILQLDNSDLDDDFSPFMKSFGENLWKNVCELSCMQQGEDRINRFVHGINIFREFAPQIVWHAAAYLKLLDNGDILNGEYWAEGIKSEFQNEEVDAIAQRYNEKYPNRIVQWDMSRSYTEAQLNGRQIDCSLAAFLTLEKLLKAPGYSARVGELEIPALLLDPTLKELIAQHYVFYVPSSKERRFKDDDMIYLTYN